MSVKISEKDNDGMMSRKQIRWSSEMEDDHGAGRVRDKIHIKL